MTDQLEQPLDVHAFTVDLALVTSTEAAERIVEETCRAWKITTDAAHPFPVRYVIQIDTDDRDPFTARIIVEAHRADQS